MVIGIEKEILACMAVADEVRESSKTDHSKATSPWNQKNQMLTGDNKGTAKAIGGHVGVTEVRAELLPQDKLELY